ncbi:hypothetical protein P7D22_19755 [Lichenihabitans sp. Uapishka_5]|uniref:hypothetical protein n=1 Tax=Lichenihabitans sp. Uapishka_5 TaxID=3037302 RepID=UPI0029E81C51|nr:hypothetical protein [Lichenihabitans sp. Uapishka_5]MDX7953404.1 hypothetical protein [Lichenihabitans sp. Uapishka_5]
MSDAPKKADRGDVESAIMDAMGDVRVLNIVAEHANDSPRNDDCPMGPAIMVPEDTFVALVRMCNTIADSVRKVERLFYEAGR